MVETKRPEIDTPARLQRFVCLPSTDWIVTRQSVIVLYLRQRAG